jgi:hypothetical protein
VSGLRDSVCGPPNFVSGTFFSSAIGFSGLDACRRSRRLIFSAVDFYQPSNAEKSTLPLFFSNKIAVSKNNEHLSPWILSFRRKMRARPLALRTTTGFLLLDRRSDAQT